MTIGWAAKSATGPLERWEFDRRDVGPLDVAIDIAYCGICHSDLHQARSEWGPAPYPLVPGHEIVGSVVGVGHEVTKHQIGDIVGVGCIVDSCGSCEACRAGLEQHCHSGVVFTYGATEAATGRTTQGGYSKHVVVTENFVLRIPDGMQPANAAPLLCAGITTYSPLNRWKVGSGSRVAIVGLGGLGSMGVRFASAMGAEVTVLSRSDAKAPVARALGADHYIDMSDDAAVDGAQRSFELILSTIPRTHDVNPYLGLLDRDGTYVVLGANEVLKEPVSASVLISRRVNIGGSLIGGIAETQEMLDFCARSGLTCEVDVIGADQINHAYERLSAGEPSGRFVIDTATIV